jgi:nicotinamide mononucleotide transporter
MLDLLNSPAFHLLGSPASWAEVLGALLGVAMVLCNIRQIHWGWPLAFTSSGLYFIVFWGSKLYGEAVLQIFFAVMALWGWHQWLRGVQADGHQLVVQRLDTSIAIKLISISALFYCGGGFFLSYYTSSDVPWWDALTTALSVVATFLLGRKLIENWLLWVLVNAISIALFAVKGLWLTVTLYAVFLVMAVLGWRAWRVMLPAQTATPSK